MEIKGLDQETQKKAREAKTMEDFEGLANECEQVLSDEVLEAVNGGNYGPTPSDCTSFVVCPKAVGFDGLRCERFRFM